MAAPAEEPIHLSRARGLQYSREAGLRETSCRCADLRRRRLTCAFRVLPYHRSLVRAQLPRRIVGHRLPRSLSHKAGYSEFTLSLLPWSPFGAERASWVAEVRHLRRHPKHPDDRSSVRRVPAKAHYAWCGAGGRQANPGDAPVARGKWKKATICCEARSMEWRTFAAKDRIAGGR
jgi:hypothetical protein